MNRKSTFKDKSVASCFEIKERNRICSISLKGLPQEVLGMDMESLRNFWNFLSLYDEKPPHILLLKVRSGLFGSKSIEHMMADLGFYCLENGRWSEEKVANSEYPFLREIHTLQRMVRQFMNIDTTVIYSSSGETMISLFGFALSCDYRIVADNFVLVNKMEGSVFSPMGGVPWFLTRMLGKTGAWQLLRENREIHADEILELGLVDQIVPLDRLKEESWRVAEEFSALPWGYRVGLKRTMSATGGTLENYLEVEESIFKKTISRLRNKQ